MQKQTLFDARASPTRRIVFLPNAPPVDAEEQHSKEEIEQEVKHRLQVPYVGIPNEQKLFEEAYKDGVREVIKEHLKLKGKNPTKEASAELRKEGEKSKEKLDKLASTNNMLFRASSFFPFDLFPDEITIDMNKVNIVERIFFFSDHVHSIAIRSIKDIDIETSLFFAKLRVVPDGYPNNPLTIRYLKKGDAIRARKIIQGLIVADREHVDPAIVQGDNVSSQMEEIGTIKEVE